MTARTELECGTDLRRAAILARQADGVDVTGIDHIVVNADQRSLEVFFIGAEPPSELTTGTTELFTIEGGRRVVVRVVGVGSTPGTPSSLHLELSGPGDFSDYVLEIRQPPGSLTTLDESFRRCVFNFKVQCPSRFDCRPPAPQVEPPPPGIEVDYLAKDYASFRQALVDLIPRLSPQWTERLAADFGMTVLELLAYVGDQLSYYQDAVANEAYLETARQRVSVRRHARLVDYHMHDGASARALVFFQLAPGTTVEIAEDDQPLRLLTKIAAPIGATPPGTVIAEGQDLQARQLTDAVFETFSHGRLDARLNAVPLHDWAGSGCRLPIGAVSADLQADLTDLLRPGDLLLLEELADPDTHDTTMADPSHRQVVRLTSVDLVHDNLAEPDLTRVAWDPADGLRFPLAIGAVGSVVLAVARGNLLLADHGATVTETGRSPDPLESGGRAARFTLERGPLSFRPSTPDAGPAVLLEQVDPHGATPQVTPRSEAHEWAAVPTLLGSTAFERRVAVETRDDGRAQLRFGYKGVGMGVDLDASFDVEYRVGIGAEGNVGADAIRHVVDRAPGDGSLDGVVEEVRNPLPAWGGVEPESTDAVRVAAPAAFRATQDRAVTEKDYAEIAERHPQVRKAVAWFRWTGSWRTVFISIDPAGRHELDPEDAATITTFVEGFAQVGYDVEVVAATQVPLALTLLICVEPDHFRAEVERAVRSRLTAGVRPSGAFGFFHPDRLTFGQPLHLSRLYAEVAEIDGVESVEAIRFGRLADDEPEAGGEQSRVNRDRGLVPIGPREIARLDDDRDFPENGILTLTLKGGR
jgi:hypothetical protein